MKYSIFFTLSKKLIPLDVALQCVTEGAGKVEWDSLVAADVSIVAEVGLNLTTHPCRWPENSEWKVVDLPWSGECLSCRLRRTEQVDC